MIEWHRPLKMASTVYDPEICVGVCQNHSSTASITFSEKERKLLQLTLMTECQWSGPHSECVVVRQHYTIQTLLRGSWRGVPNPISQKLFFFKSQAVLLKLKSHSHFSIVFFFHESQSQCTNTISQPLKKANPTSHFNPSRPSSYLTRLHTTAGRHQNHVLNTSTSISGDVSRSSSSSFGTLMH